MSDEHDTPLSTQAAEPSDPPSWHVPLKRVEDRVSKLETAFEEKLTSIEGGVSSLVAQATKDPTVRKHLVSILASVATLLALAVAALAGRASSTPPAQAPAPAITVVMPKEAHS